MDWTVRGMDEAARRRAADAAEAAGLPLAAWLDRAILDHAAGYVPPPAWAARKDAAPDEADDDSDGLVDPQAQARIQRALDALDARLQRSDRNIAGVVTPLTRKIDAISDRAGAHKMTPPPGSAIVQLPMPPAAPPLVTRNRRYRRGLGAIAAFLLLLSAAGAGGLVWLWFETQEPPPNRYAEMTEEELLRSGALPRQRATPPRAVTPPPVAAPAAPSTTPSGAPAEFADLEALIAKSRAGQLGEEHDDATSAATTSDAAPLTGAESEAAPAIAAKPAPLEAADHAGTSATGGNDALIARLRAQAAANDAKAQHDLALLMMEGRQLPRDPNTAGELFEKAALQGLANAQYNLGVIYDQGIGRPADPTMAFFWYNAAADQGHVPAQYNLGVAAAQGRGTVRDYAVAANWFERAAKTGLPDAEFNLGQLYENGFGVTQDLKRAYELYRSAAAKGYAPASQRLAAVESRLAAPGPATARATPPAAPPVAGGPLTSKEIIEMQTLLQKLALLKTKPDGMIGPATRDALREYQAIAGLRQTGVPTRELLIELREVAVP